MVKKVFQTTMEGAMEGHHNVRPCSISMEYGLLPHERLNMRRGQDLVANADIQAIARARAEATKNTLAFSKLHPTRIPKAKPDFPLLPIQF